MPNQHPSGAERTVARGEVLDHLRRAARCVDVLALPPHTYATQNEYHSKNYQERAQEGELEKMKLSI